MKPIFTLIVFLLGFYPELHAQNYPAGSKHPLRRAWIELTNADTARGFIMSRDDSTLVYARKTSFLRDMQSVNSNVRALSYKDIYAVHYHRKGGVWMGIGIGVVSGCLIGALIGAVTYQAPPPPPPNADPLTIYFTTTKQDNILSGAVLGTFSGILIGAVVGAVVHHKFTIEGKKERFQHMQKKLRLTY